METRETCTCSAAADCNLLSWIGSIGWQWREKGMERGIRVHWVIEYHTLLLSPTWLLLSGSNFSVWSWFDSLFYVLNFLALSLSPPLSLPLSRSLPSLSPSVLIFISISISIDTVKLNRSSITSSTSISIIGDRCSDDWLNGSREELPRDRRGECIFAILLVVYRKTVA